MQSGDREGRGVTQYRLSRNIQKVNDLLHQNMRKCLKSVGYKVSVNISAFRNTKQLVLPDHTSPDWVGPPCAAVWLLSLQQQPGTPAGTCLKSATISKMQPWIFTQCSAKISSHYIRLQKIYYYY